MSYFFPPLPYFVGFTAFTPEVPKMYWNVKSQEQRILEICKHIDKLIAYADTLANRINDLDLETNEQFQELKTTIKERLDAQDQAIANGLKAQNIAMTKALAELRRYVDARFDEIAEGQLAYDVTTGTYRPNRETMRRLYSALAYSNTGARAIVSDMAENMTVSQLAQMTTYKAAWSQRDTIIIDDQIPTIEGN